MQQNSLAQVAFLGVSAAILAVAVVDAVVAQVPDSYVTTGCGMFDGKLCKTVKVTSCSGSNCTEETSYYYYSAIIE